MLNEQILGRLGHLKNNVQHLMSKFSEKKLFAGKKKVITPDQIHIDNYHYESHRFDEDLPLTLARDSGPGVKYSYTENSEFARGAEKENAIGIDKFGEEDTFDPDEADEHQDYRNRRQNSDLSQRYFTGGLDELH